MRKPGVPEQRLQIGAEHPELTALNTVVVKLQVRETLKGQAGSTYTFRQYVWDIRDLKYAGGYQKGQDLLLMMIAPSEYGLSSGPPCSTPMRRV